MNVKIELKIRRKWTVHVLLNRLYILFMAKTYKTPNEHIHKNPGSKKYCIDIINYNHSFHFSLSLSLYPFLRPLGLAFQNETQSCIISILKEEYTL